MNPIFEESMPIQAKAIIALVIIGTLIIIYSIAQCLAKRKGRNITRSSRQQRDLIQGRRR